MFFSIKDSFETALKKRQKERIEASSMKRKLEQDKKQKSSQIRKRESGRDSIRKGRMSSAVATPGRSISGTPKFMPKKKGRIGF
jgi:hypothetical protein